MDITSWSKPWNDEPPVWIFVSMYPAGTYIQLGVVLRNVLGSSQANPVWDISIESNLKHRVDVAIEVSWTTVSISMTALIHRVYAIVTWVRDMSVLDVQGVLPRHLAPFVFTGRKPILLHRCIPIWWCRSRCAKCLDMSLRFHLGMGFEYGHWSLQNRWRIACRGSKACWSDARFRFLSQVQHWYNSADASTI